MIFKNLFTAVVCLSGLVAHAQTEKLLMTRIAKNTYPMEFDGKRIGGPGGTWLMREAEKAQFVLVGESHNKKEIEDFCKVLFTPLEKKGFRFLAIENGRISAQLLYQFAKSPDGPQNIKSHMARYTYCWPFYDRKPGYELLQSFVQADPKHAEIWGIDQEFIYASRHLLTAMAELSKKPENRKRLEALAEQAQKYFAEGLKVYMATGKEPEKFEFMAKAQPETWQELKDIVKSEKNPELEKILFELEKSHHIYYQSEYSHEERVQFMKSNFIRNYRALEKRMGQPPKGFLKMGNMHTGKGYTSLQVLDMGNFVAELAASYGKTSLHINMLTRKYTTDGDKDLLDYNPKYRYLVGSGPKDQPLVINLRAIRPYIGSAQRKLLGQEMSEMIRAHDVAVILPVFNEGEWIVPLGQ